MRTAELGDLVLIQYSRIPTLGAKTGKPPMVKSLEFNVGTKDIVPSVSLGVLGMAVGDKKQILFETPERESTLPLDTNDLDNVNLSPRHLDLRVVKQQPETESVVPRPSSDKPLAALPKELTPVDLEITLMSVNSSPAVDKRKPQMDVGGEGG